MKTKTIVKIEDDLIRILTVEENNGISVVDQSLIFEFTHQLKEELGSSPEALSDFMVDSLKNGDFDHKKVILLFGGKLGFFREYTYKNTDKKLGDERFYIEVDGQKKICGGSCIVQRLDYPEKQDENICRSAIFGIKDTFFRALVKSLKRKGVKVVFAMSSLAVYKDSVENTLSDINPRGLWKRIIGVDLEGNSYKVVVFDENELLHLEEQTIPPDAGPEERNLTDMLTDILKKYGSTKDRTSMIVSGTESEIIAKRINRYSGIPCEPIKDDFAVTALNIKKNKNESYLYGGCIKKKIGRDTSRICIVATVLLAILLSVLPLYMIYMEHTNKKLNAEIAKYADSEILRLIHEKRDVYANLQVFKDILTNIESGGMVYSETLSVLKENLPNDTVVNDLLYDETSALMIHFSTSDLKNYENAVKKMNDEKNLIVSETGRNKDDATGKYDIQIKITVPQKGAR